MLHEVPEVFPTCSVEVAPAMRIIYDRVASFFSLLYRVMGSSGLLTRQGRCGAALNMRSCTSCARIAGRGCMRFLMFMRI